MKRNIFYPNMKSIVLAVILFAVSVLLILQLIPVFESQTLGAKIVNLIVSPPNFIFEDVFGINSIKIIDYITWFLQLIYAYFIAVLLLYLTNRRNK